MAPLVVLLLSACGTPSLPPGDPDVPDVILVSVDTLRADHVGAWGHDRPTTPFIDTLAAQGVRYAEAWAPSPWTLPSHATLLSGRTPARHGAVEDDLGLGPGTPLLAEVLRGRGVATAGVVSSLFVSGKYGFDRGFDAFEDFGIRTSAENLAGEADAREVVDAALRLAADLPRGKPAFLFVHFYDAHYAYDPPAPYDTLFDRAPRRKDPRYRQYAWYLRHPLDEAALAHQVAQYDEAIRYVDDEIRRLAEAWTAAGREVTWAITSDHGEEFGERGSWGHGHTLYREQLHVPLVLSGARVDTPATVVAPVGLQDVAPRIAAWFGASMPAPDGVPLPLAEVRAAPPGRALAFDTSRFRTDRHAILQGRLKLEVDLAAGTRTLYDLAADPGEREDLASARPDDASRLEPLLWRSQGTPWTARGAVDLSTPGTLLVDGRVVGRSARIEAGTAFQVVPVDAPVRSADAEWRPLAGRAPGPGDPVTWDGQDAASVALTDAERERLEALGYVQGE